MLAVPLLVVVPGGDEDPIARVGRIDGGLDGGELAGDAAPSPHAQNVPLRLPRRQATVVLFGEARRAARRSSALVSVSRLRAGLRQDPDEDGSQGELCESPKPVGGGRRRKREEGAAHCHGGLLFAKATAYWTTNSTVVSSGIGRIFFTPIFQKGYSRYEHTGPLLR